MHDILNDFFAFQIEGKEFRMYINAINILLIEIITNLSFYMVPQSAFKKGKSVQSEFIRKVKDEILKQPPGYEEILTDKEIEHLPLPVRKYIKYSGAIGRDKPQNVQIEFEAKMVSKPGAAHMNATSVQYNFYRSFTRIFMMKADKMFIPFRALHVYCEQEATFVVRVANLFNVVDINGEELTTAETVTLLNDMCLFVPGNLCDKRLSWKEIDSLSSRVTIENGKYKVSAILNFNEKGELINFVSDDRYALQNDGKMKKARWSTPVKDYKEIDGRRIPTYGETIWNYPEGDFTYGIFRLKSINYNVTH
jgi:hypothetical protein